jgi:hypothetical protein
MFRQLFPVTLEKEVLKNRCIGLLDVRTQRRDFYRFNTKPNWAAHVAALKGAHLAMIEAERG